jgi:RNA polymerase sigma-70 factor (ECF subfamily)
VRIRRYLRDQRHSRLLARAKAGDTEAFRRLYRELYDLVNRYLSGRLQQREDVEDLIARLFHRFLERLDRYDSRRGSVAAWLLTMARNALVDHYRSRRETVSIESLADILSGNGGDPLQDIIRDEEARSVRALLKELPAETQEMFSLRFSYDMSYRDIALCVGSSETAVKQRFSRALRELRARLARRSERGGEVDYAI